MVGRSVRFNHLTSKKHEWTPARRRTLSCLLVSLLLFSWPLLSYLRCYAATQPSFLSHSSLLLPSFSFQCLFLFFFLSFSLLCALSHASQKIYLRFSFSFFISLIPIIPSLSRWILSFWYSACFEGDQIHVALKNRVICSWRIIIRDFMYIDTYI